MSNTDQMTAAIRQFVVEPIQKRSGALFFFN